MVANPTWVLNPLFLITIRDTCHLWLCFKWKSVCFDTLRGHLQALDTGRLLEPVYLPPRGMHWKHAEHEKASQVRSGFQVPLCTLSVPRTAFLPSTLKALAAGLCQAAGAGRAH